MKFFVLKAYGEPPELKMKESSIPDLLEDYILVVVIYSAFKDCDWYLITGKTTHAHFQIPWIQGGFKD